MILLLIKGPHVDIDCEYCNVYFSLLQVSMEMQFFHREAKIFF